MKWGKGESIKNGTILDSGCGRMPKIRVWLSTCGMERGELPCLWNLNVIFNLGVDCRVERDDCFEERALAS